METIRMLGELTYYGRKFFETDYWVCPQGSVINGWSYYTASKKDDSTKVHTATCEDGEYEMRWKKVPDYHYEPRYNYRTRQTGEDSDGNPITVRERIEPFQERVPPLEKDVQYRVDWRKPERRRGKGDGG